MIDKDSLKVYLRSLSDEDCDVIAESVAGFFPGGKIITFSMEGISYKKYNDMHSEIFVPAVSLSSKLTNKWTYHSVYVIDGCVCVPELKELIVSSESYLSRIMELNPGISFIEE